MRLLPLLLIAAAQTGPRIQVSNTAEGLRGVSAVSRQIAWSSGTHGTYLRTTDGGATWTPAQVPDAATLDFRAVVAFSADEAFLMSAGPADQSRIYHTSDAGQHWQLQFTNTNPKGFFDSMVFWDRTHGIVLGDPVPDVSGTLKFELLRTDDGQTWRPIPPDQLPPAQEGEGAFAASNSCLAILNEMTTSTEAWRGNEAWRSNKTWKSGPSGPREAPIQIGASAPVTPDSNIWFATGGKVARVLHSPDRGQTWQVFATPLIHGQDSTGIFSIAFRDALHGVIAGGDYKHPGQDGPNLAFTEDGGKTWTLSPIHPQAYFSAVAYDRKINDETAAELKGKRTTQQERLFLVGHDFIFDYRPPSRPGRLNATKSPEIEFNAVAPYPEGGALVVGPKGVIATVP